jgi:hypothetical protein
VKKKKKNPKIQEEKNLKIEIWKGRGIWLLKMLTTTQQMICFDGQWRGWNLNFWTQKNDGKTSNEMKEDMHKHVNEIKENMNKQLSEFNENTKKVNSYE